MRKRVWTTWRKLWGNIAPLILATPVFGYGVAQLWITKDLFSAGIWWLIGGVATGWVAVNFLGLAGNRTMRRSVERLLIENGESLDQRRTFVGIATPTYSSVLDPHEDVGFLILKPEALHFIGDHRKLVLGRHSVRKVYRRANIHSWIGLGGWVVIDATVGDKAARLLIEPRERATLLGNRLMLAKLSAEIQAWQQAKQA